MRGIDDETRPPFARFGAIHRAAVRAEWAAAQATGLDLRIEDDGETLLGAAPGHPSGMFNRALGIAELPDRVDEAVAFFTRHGVEGEIVLDPVDVPRGVEPRVRLDAYLGTPRDIEPVASDGVTFRVIGPDEIGTWVEVVIEAYAPDATMAALWRSMAPHAAVAGDRINLVGEVDGRPVAACSAFLAGRSAWLSWAAVVPDARGRGIQRAMIAARARLTDEHGCDTIAAWALVAAHSSENLARAGLPRIGERVAVKAADLG